MRITPIILIALGLWGLFMPEMFSTLDEQNGRWLAGLIILLGTFTLWRSWRRR